MHINLTLITNVVAKRAADDNADIDAEYQEAMEEIEERKKTCKALEYAGHATGLVTNLIGDIPEIPLVTDTVKIATSGIAAAAHVAEFGMNIAATAMECDDVNFDEIKAIMEKRFSEIDRKLDKMSEAMEKVTEVVTKTFNSVEKTRAEMNWGFKNVLATLKSREIQSILSKINKFVRYFEEKRKEISKLPLHQFVFRLKEKDGILSYLQKARKPEGLHSDLLELMDKNNNFAIPENAEDTKAFQALYALFYGTQTYASVMFFLLKQHSYLADYYYQTGRDKKFNEAFDVLITTFNEFKASLTRAKGLINEVVKTLEEVKNKDFIKDVKNELYDDISKRIDGLKDLKTNITKMVLNVIEDIPEPVLDIDFNEPHIASNYGDWDDKSKVRYAVQLTVNGTYSKFGEWTEPVKVYQKANPTLQVPRDEKGRLRLVFRKFNEEKPQLVAILSKSSQVEFRDIDRDLYNAARSKDQTRPLEYIPTLLDAGANMHATFEMKRNVMHAAAESGNVKIAMRFFSSGTQEQLLNARDEKGFTPIHIAASTRNSGFVKFLVDQNADVNVQTAGDKVTPLHIAAKRGFFKTIKNLLASNKIEINKREKSGYTPLHYAVRGIVKAIKILLADDKILINAKSNFGLTPFHLAVMKGDREICDALLSSGKVEVNAGNKDNMTPLHFAAMAGNVDMIQYLLSGKKELEEVNINAVTSDNIWTPLHFAIYFKHVDAALELLKNDKIDVSMTSKQSYTPLHFSIATGQLKIFHELLRKDSNLEALTKEKFTALHLATLRSETDFATTLLDKNANINAVSDDGSTPLHLATKSDKIDQMVLLINRGANMKLYDGNNFLPFHYAIKNVNLRAMKAAVEKDPSLTDTNHKEGKSIMKYSIHFIFGLIYHYYKNKDSVEYRKFKDLPPLEVFKKLGYYDLLQIVRKDSSNSSEKVDRVINAGNRFAIWCIKRENSKGKTCSFKGVRDKRKIESLNVEGYPHPTVMGPTYQQNLNNVLINMIHSMKQIGSNKSFPYSNPLMIQNADTNGILLLVDLLVRKFTNEKYNVSNNTSISTLESQGTALKIIDKFSAFVDTVSDIPAEELIDLTKLHSDLYKSIESGNSNNIFYLLCQHLRNIVDAEQVTAFLSGVMTNDEDMSKEKYAVNTIIKYCISEANMDNAS
ncbi:delta-latroinsectotoxin-Lt1a-like [Parasteatoda tepidariorum]|uniref:delta-latroinsectotoxin-Lt1a-like n=1 Tax=Parasteatoda tepidariorum TaxID=114398 RepID=UPI0039BC467B